MAQPKMINSVGVASIRYRERKTGLMKDAAKARLMGKKVAAAK